MKGKRYSQEQKVYALKQVEAGSQVVEVCRQLGRWWMISTNAIRVGGA